MRTSRSAIDIAALGARADGDSTLPLSREEKPPQEKAAGKL
jgi:hypothetical protein